MNKWDEMRAAVREAKNTIQAADSCVVDMVGIVRNRLKCGNVPAYMLNDLKRELADWDMHRKVWKR